VYTFASNNWHGQTYDTRFNLADKENSTTNAKADKRDEQFNHQDDRSKPSNGTAQQQENAPKSEKGEKSEKNEKSKEHHSLHSEKDFQALAKALCLSVAYGAYCGGLGTLTGTTPNLIMKNVADEWVVCR